MDSRHQHLFSAIAAKLGMEESQVEDFMLEGEQVRMRDSTAGGKSVQLPAAAFDLNLLSL